MSSPPGGRFSVLLYLKLRAKHGKTGIKISKACTFQFGDSANASKNDALRLNSQNQSFKLYVASSNVILMTAKLA